MKRALPFHSPVVWPPVWMVVFFALIYSMLTVGLWFMEIRWGSGAAEFADSPECERLRGVILGVAAVVYALYRLWRFHPACNRAYAAWLALSPWTHEKPLPLGPVLFVWQDAAVIVVLTAVAQWHAHVDPTIPVVAFGLTWLIGMTILLAIVRIWPALLALGFLWPALMLPGMADGLGFVVIGTIFLVIWWGHRRSLRTFPWPASNAPDRLSVAASGRSGQSLDIRLDIPGAEPVYLGWPHLALSPKFSRPAISVSTSLWLSALAGWWTYCFIRNSGMDAEPGLVLFYSMAVALIRVGIYCSSVQPPFNLWGRITSGPLILPGFDQIFVVPLAVVLAGVVGGTITRWSGPWHPLAESCLVAVLSYMSLAGGPRLKNWMLTGQLRFRAAPANKSNTRLRRV